MGEVLRAAGGERRERAPQPTLRDVPALVAASGIRATTDLDLPADLPAAAQRAVYRTVQEGLTNARKHATGADVRITGRLDAGHVVLEVEAGRATLPRGVGRRRGVGRGFGVRRVALRHQSARCAPAWTCTGAVTGCASAIAPSAVAMRRATASGSAKSSKECTRR